MRVKGTNIDVLFFVWDVSESALPLGSWAIPETDFNAMMIRLVSNGSDQCDNNGLTAITLIAQSFAEIFDPTFDCNDFVKNSTSSYIGEYVTLTYSHNGFEYKLEGSPSTVGSLKSYDYDFTISLSANKD